MSRLLEEAGFFLIFFPAGIQLTRPFSTRIFQCKNPASLRLRTAKGLLNLSRKENVSQTLSSLCRG